MAFSDITNIRYNSVRGWMFTWNNPEHAICDFPAGVRCVYQLEMGVMGTIHYQGYAEWDERVSFATVKQWLPLAHWEPRRHNRRNAIAYVTKEKTRMEGPFWYPSKEEFGVEKAGQGKRSDLEDVRAAISGGASKRQIYENFSSVAAACPRWVDTMFKYHQEDSVSRLTDVSPINDMQEFVMALPFMPVHPRWVYWMYDPNGDTGKTFIARYMVDSHDTFYCNGGKGVDILFGYQGQSLVIFDYVRDSAEYVNYGVIEQLKNGLYFTSKYESRMARCNPPHIVVLANFAPEAGKFSRNRCVVSSLDDSGNFRATRMVELMGIDWR